LQQQDSKKQFHFVFASGNPAFIPAPLHFVQQIFSCIFCWALKFVQKYVHICHHSKNIHKYLVDSSCFATPP
jgi:hypothetical protein